MVRFKFEGATVEIEDKELTTRLLENHQRLQIAAEAEQKQLSQSYTVEQLAQRLNISTRSAYELIRNGLISYTCTGGTKGYRSNERAVRLYEDGLASKGTKS